MTFVIETSYGIYKTNQPMDEWEHHLIVLGDNEYPFLAINTDAGRIYFNPETILYMMEIDVE